MIKNKYALAEEEKFNEEIFDLMDNDDIEKLDKHIGDKPFKLEWLIKALTKDKFKSIQYLYPIYFQKCKDEEWIDKERIPEINKQFISLAIIGKDKNILTYLFQFIDINEVNSLNIAREFNHEIIDWLVEQGAKFTANNHQILKEICSETGSSAYQIPELKKIYAKYITAEQKEEAWKIIHQTLTENKMESKYADIIHKNFYEYHKQELLKMLKLKLDELPKAFKKKQPKL